MAQRRMATSHNNRTVYRTTSYVDGNLAVDTNVRRQLEEEPRRQLSNETKKNREKAHHMSLGYVTFLLAALFTCAIVLINYVQLQSELTTQNKVIAERQSEVNSLRVANDEAYNKIKGRIDLEEIKRIAIGELGMTYAQEGQIVTYSNEGRDYMRQVTNTN